MDEHGGKVLVGENKSGRLYCYFEEWKGQRMLHFRYWYQDKNDGMWKPGLKGIAIPDHMLKSLVEALKSVLA
ncbi:MAG: transcriptional coactivator p15/PC4 family protein [Candidatus Obscuribacterales bacterium]|nr:transcriptional coactivator p15/PC4 family protein [Candidatus Obscuribacterales bacterium]